MQGLLTLSDGRTLEWADNGIDSTQALVFHNGTTCGLTVWNAWLEQAAKSGVRAIALNRPGVGASTRKPGRRITDDVNDVRELIEQLGITKFVSVGWSGGGARALGTTKISGCVAVHAIAGIPQADFDNELWNSTVTPERLARIELGRTDPEAMLKLRSSTYEEERDMTSEAVLSFLEKDMPNYKNFEADYKVLAEDFAKSIRDALAQGPEADTDDFLANVNEWGFEISEITHPVTLWHGDLDDDVEFRYGEYNHSRISGSTLIRLEGLGHLDIIVEPRERILSSAIASLRR